MLTTKEEAHSTHSLDEGIDAGMAHRRCKQGQELWPRRVKCIYLLDLQRAKTVKTAQTPTQAKRAAPQDSYPCSSIDMEVWARGDDDVRARVMVPQLQGSCGPFCVTGEITTPLRVFAIITLTAGQAKLHMYPLCSPLTPRPTRSVGCLPPRQIVLGGV